MDDCLDAYAAPNQSFNIDNVAESAGSSVLGIHSIGPTAIAIAGTVNTYVGYCSAAVATTLQSLPGLEIHNPFHHGDYMSAFTAADVLGDSGPGRSDGCSSLGWYDLSACLSYTYTSTWGSLVADQPLVLEGGPADPTKACNRHVGAPGLGANYIAEYCIEADLVDAALGTTTTVRDGDHHLVQGGPLTAAEHAFVHEHDIVPGQHHHAFLNGSNLEENRDTGQCGP